ncbi:MAG: acyl-CoA dehydrogenase [SAR202 cluster bacterium]|nr:acyl-CoA dehydrogenase [SAR202 cluster bacterium]|tara:strand:- start:13998 stop:15155 length:1158 start_codon:yes stop_codon:yes gene_type:complete
MNSQLQDLNDIRNAVRDVCKKYDGNYWRSLEKEGKYPEEFVTEMTALGWLSALIPSEYGGGGMSVTEASVILEEINRSGGDSAACHAQMYIMGVILRHGNSFQKQKYLPGIAAGDTRLQAFAVTEPDAGSETTRIQTTAKRSGDKYIINGQKIWISRVAQSDLMLLLARTTPYEELENKTEGLSVFVVDMRTAGTQIEVRPIDMTFNRHTNQLFFDNLEVPAENLIGEEGKGFRYIIDSWNAERILIAAEAIGDAKFFIDKASEYASSRIVFGRPIGANQGVQLPIAQAYAHTEAADLMRFDAAGKFDRGERCGAEANMAKFLAANAAWEAGNACLNTFGGYGFAKEYDIERKFRETRLFITAPVNNNLILAYIGQNVLKMPRSY